MEQQRPVEKNSSFIACLVRFAQPMTCDFAKFSWKKFAWGEIPTRNNGTVPRLLRSKPQLVKDLHFFELRKSACRSSYSSADGPPMDFQGVLAQPCLLPLIG